MMNIDYSGHFPQGQSSMEQQKPPKLLIQVKEKIRFLHYSCKTEQAYVRWIKRFILFHGKKASSRYGRR